MSRNILDSAAGGAFMGKTIVEAKNILESILQNYSQWNTERAPNPSLKVNSIEETNDLSSKMDTILAFINKQNIENVPLQELVGNNPESVVVTIPIITIVPNEVNINIFRMITNSLLQWDIFNILFINERKNSLHFR